jgi:hypothetical protein
LKKKPNYIKKESGISNGISNANKTNHVQIKRQTKANFQAKKESIPSKN